MSMQEDEARFVEGLDLAAPAQGRPATEDADTETEEPQGETVEERLRDPETGQFESPEQHKERLISGKYRWDPDVIEDVFREKDSFIGKLSDENRELRGLIQQPQQPQQPQYDEADLEDWIERDPRGAAVYAWQNGDARTWEMAINALDAVSPAAAHDLVARRVVAEQQQQLVQQVIQPMQQTYHSQTLASAWNAASSRLPDFEQMADAMQTAAQRSPELLMPLAQGTQEQKERVFETLYYMARGMTGITPQPQAQESTPSPQADSLAQRVAATVASATQVPTGPGQEIPAENQRLYDLWDQETGFTQ